MSHGSHSQWRNVRFEHEENLAEMGPTSKHSEKKPWELIVNTDVDGYTRTPTGKYSEKRKKQQPTENRKNAKTEI